MRIDFRVRPPIPSYRTEEFYNNFADVEQRSARFGTGISSCARTFSMDLLLQEFDELRLDRAVVPIRKGCGGNNEDLLALHAQYPDRFVGLAGIAPLSQGVDGAIDEIDHYVLQGPCRGVALEPAFDPDTWHVDDARVFPIFDFCQSHHVPVVLTFGGIFTPSLGLYDPLELDRMAAAFPTLKIALCHGGWPHVNQVCEIAFNRHNVYIAPDMYMLGGPGTQDYIAAANTILYDRIIFASAAPIISTTDALYRYENCGISARSLPYVMGDNAAELLGL